VVKKRLNENSRRWLPKLGELEMQRDNKTIRKAYLNILQI